MDYIIIPTSGLVCIHIFYIKIYCLYYTMDYIIYLPNSIQHYIRYIVIYYIIGNVINLLSAHNIY